MKRTLLSISVATLLAASIEGSQFDTINKQSVSALDFVDENKYDLIGKITGDEENNDVVLQSSKYKHIAFNPDHDTNVLALVLKNKQNGEFTMLHTMNNIDENISLQKKLTQTSLLQNGDYAISMTVASNESSAEAKIHSDGLMLFMTNSSGMPITFAEPSAELATEMIICANEFNPVNKIIAASEQDQSASA
ncbi:MAG: hypothetical protein PHG82_01570 [Candidatus Gracilibacteria bacterium]|nr:hypothetical protein [Candidatus Gracilibacteria bacterium]